VSYDFLIYTVPSSMEGMPLAIALLAEGYSVALAIMDEKKAEPEAPPWSYEPSIVLRRKLQQLVGTGLVEKVSADKIKPSKDTLVIFDFNYGAKYGAKITSLGVKGIITPLWAYELEHDRAKAADFVRKNYPQLSLPEEEDFPENSARAVLEFIQSSEDFWVIKPNSNELSVFLPSGNRETYLAMAEHYISDNEQALNDCSIQLQRKIYGYEAVCETWYREGEPILCNVDLELKNQYAGNLPPQTGCAADLVFTIPLDSEFRRIVNKPFDKFAEEQNFTGVMDANVIFEDKTGKPYFLEFCPARFGYNCLYAFLDKLKGNIGDFFSWAILGQPEFHIPNEFGASVRIFDAAHYGNLLHRLEEGKISFRELFLGEPSSVWLWDAMKDNGRLKVVGANPNTAIVTASAPSAEAALSRVKDLAKLVEFEGAYFRYDIDDREGTYSILNRLDYLLERDLFSVKVKRVGRSISAKEDKELLEVSL